MLVRGILGSERTRGVSFRPFPNSSGWRWLISSVFLIRISCHKTTHANGYYGTWPGWAVSISVLPLSLLHLHFLLWKIRIQFSVAKSCPTLWDPTDCSISGFPVLHHLPELAQTHVHWVSDDIQPPHPLLSPSPPTSVFPRIRVFSSKSALYIRWPKYWSFSFNISQSFQWIFRVYFL